MLPIANRPFLEHQIDHLRRHGVTRVILSCGYLPDPIRDHFGDSLEYVDRAGAAGYRRCDRIAAARHRRDVPGLQRRRADRSRLTALIEFHRRAGAGHDRASSGGRSQRATGWCAPRPTARSTAFVEKPTAGHGGRRHDQRRHLRDGAGRAGADRAGRDGVGRAGGVSAADWGRPVCDGRMRRRGATSARPTSYLAANLEAMPAGGLIDPHGGGRPGGDVTDSVIGPVPGSRRERRCGARWSCREPWCGGRRDRRPGGRQGWGVVW